MLATALSYALQHSGLNPDPRMAGSIVLIVAFLKVRLIGMHFMELREAMRPLRLLFNAWTVIMMVILLAMLWETS